MPRPRSRPLIRLSLAASLLAASACASAQPQTEAPVCEQAPDTSVSEETGPRDQIAEIDALNARARELFEVPGLAVAVVHEGEVLLERGYGERELGGGVAVDAHTSFQIASNTKAFIATAVGLLVADGVLDWDDRVIEHMPELRLWNEHVTADLRVRDLLSHRVGLATWAGDLMWLSAAKIMRQDGGLWFEAHEHGGLRCRLAEQALANETVACTWDDPNMGVSEFTIVNKGKRVKQLRFRVRPSFYDPLEYTFERAR